MANSPGDRKAWTRLAYSAAAALCVSVSMSVSPSVGPSASLAAATPATPAPPPAHAAALPQTGAQTGTQSDTQNPPAARIERPGAIPAEDVVTPPPPGMAGQQPARTAPAQTAPLNVPAVNGPWPMAHEARLTLRIGYTDALILNPGTRSLDRVRLRSYTNEGGAPTDAPFVAPTIEVFPGETVRLTLRNELPPEPDCDTPNINTPHCFNKTNLHGHGLEVSPAGNSDNVMLSIRPQVAFQYEYNIPADHPAGTYWYHPHRHGSTALQVGSGMAGALIVRGNRLPTNYGPGDMDTLLRNPDGSSYIERVMVFQQIAYACRTSPKGPIKRNPNGTWLCQTGDVGEIESYDVFGQTTWKDSGRYTTINGRTAEPLAQHAIVGRPERWRLVHAGVRDTLRLSIRRRRPSAAATATAYASLTAQSQQAWIDANCEPGVLSLYEFAADGLTRTKILRKENLWLQPGYRSDLLVTFPTAGEYCVVDEAAPAAQTVNNTGGGRQLLTLVTADGEAPAGAPSISGDPDAYLKKQLQAAASQFMPANVRQRVIDDMNTFTLGAFMAPHASILHEKPSMTRTIMFNFPPGIGTNAGDTKQYDPKRIDMQMTLGSIEGWTLRSAAGGHPFHIHINPFQIESVKRPKDGNKDLTQDPTSEYYGLAGTWKDTLFVPTDTDILVRSQINRYIGDFVLHCHILDHEDTGMMQNVRIVLPDGRGGQEAFGHGLSSH